MAEEGTGLEESGWATHAREFIPSTHRGLSMLRLYLPFRDPTLDDGNNIVRWSRYVSVEDHSASLDWFEATAGIAEELPSVRGLVSCMGVLDEETANALRDAIGAAELQCLRWMGYGEAPHTSSPRRVFGEEYLQARLRREDVKAGRTIPEFAWDAERRLAWGGRLYPDSLIVAAEQPVFRQLINDPRLDTVSVRAERDDLPPSAGD
ncbi:hypothetical protein KKR91_07860 [Arthrobacter jiangjiafuii]|uniref:Uncharacterized protein n=1 Tax=Arthrobacter jiangjiafuii TaxID=2817475 RepID=A0A975R0Z6_9MICC|nr:hypothetical protein [Arthrobacter jiangjiafuii]MBP3042919.1 hypothetical protein [Arthrobacter jiangjiafuii]QWC11450.1 hypothetical protein KKR91_07860 [Arthrobacter jiangjiafuii]